MTQRITIRLDDALYDRLLLFAQGRSQGQSPEVSGIVREALEHYLTPPTRHLIPPTQHHGGHKKSDTERRTARYDSR